MNRPVNITAPEAKAAALAPRITEGPAHAMARIKALRRQVPEKDLQVRVRWVKLSGAPLD